MVRERGPRFPMSSRGLSILTLHSPPAPQVMKTTRQRVIVDPIDAPERASSQEPQKVPPRRRTPSPASHAAVRLARIAPARLTARAHPDLSPRGPPRTYYDLAERLAGTPPSQREARSLPRPPAAPASLRTPVEATGRRPSSSDSPDRIGAPPESACFHAPTPVPAVVYCHRTAARSSASMEMPRRSLEKSVAASLIVATSPSDTQSPWLYSTVYLTHTRVCRLPV